MKEVMNFKYNTFSTTGYTNYSASMTSVMSSEIKIISDGWNECAEIQLDEVGKYSVFEIANWFLKKSNMTHKKLQKLCYYAQAWYYALKNKRLIDSDFQAWSHGPVSPALYERFKSFGYDTIQLKGEYNLSIVPEDVQFLEDVWETYGDRTGNALELLTHRETPWIEARRGYSTNERCSVVISPDTMASYYKSIYSGD